SASAARSDSPRVRAGAPQGALLEVPAEVRRLLTGPLPGSRAETGTSSSTIVGFAVSDREGCLTCTIPSGGTLRFWYLIEAGGRTASVSVGILSYAGGGFLFFAGGSPNRRIVLPVLEPGDRVLCAVSVTLDIQPGEYTLVPQIGGRTGEVPDFGV